ncbi:hypothetical protein O6H91_22G031900 [Diphasiastrum complanatum]|uniref:Uncharacterized protein n=1 Tax=Diphasiastrum complanatum TaxID=34168 RepID=A0ACC2AG30_DIPCM|nr:hypothetical protein O6H91_22G031900 [Diphasiastrum complanatum]
MAQVDFWSCKHLPSGLDENVLDQVFMMDDSEVPLVSLSGPLSHAHHQCDGGKRAKVKDLKGLFQRSCRKVGRNISGTVAVLSQVIATESSSKQALKEEWRKVAWSLVIKTLMQQHPGSQLPERLISSVRNHFDSLPASYARAEFSSEQVFLHIRLLDQARLERSNFAVFVQEQQCGPSRFSNASQSSSNMSSPSSSASWDDEGQTIVEAVLTFACSASVSKSAVVSAFKQVGITIKHFQLFEQKALSLGIVAVQGSRENIQHEQLQGLVRTAVQKSKSVKLNLSFRSREKSGHVRMAYTERKTAVEPNKEPDPNNRDLDVEMHRLSYSSTVNPSFKLTFLDNIQVLIDEKQGIISGREELQPWLLDIAKIDVGEPLVEGSGRATYFGMYDGCKVTVKQLNTCKATSSVVEVELRREILDLDSYPHKNILPVLGVFVDNRNRICAVNKFMEGRSLRELIQKRSVALPNMVKLAVGIAEGMQFLHHHGIVHRDLNSENIFIDSCGSAIISVLNVAQFTPEDGRMEYEMGHNHSVAPEVLRAASGRVAVSPKSDVYSFGIVLWEMLTPETPYAGYSPVQAAVAVTMHGLRPTISADCYPPLRYLIQHCWASNPSDRPTFTAILEILHLATKDLFRSTMTKAEGGQS